MNYITAVLFLMIMFGMSLFANIILVLALLDQQKKLNRLETSIITWSHKLARHIKEDNKNDTNCTYNRG